LLPTFRITKNPSTTNITIITKAKTVTIHADNPGGSGMLPSLTHTLVIAAYALTFSRVHPVIFIIVSIEYNYSSRGHQVSDEASWLIGIKYYSHNSSELEM
jgi:hypothetical protein